MVEMMKDPTNPIRRVLDLLLENAKEMMRDGRMKIVDGLPVFSAEVEQMLAERKARAHSRCTEVDPCGGIFNMRLQARRSPTKRKRKPDTTDGRCEDAPPLDAL